MHGIRRAPVLERADALQMLGLEEDRRAEPFVERPRREHRSAVDERCDPAGRILDGMSFAVPRAAVASLANVAVPARAAPEWRGLAALLQELCAAEVEWPVDFERVRMWYEPHLRRIHEDDADVRAYVVETLGGLGYDVLEAKSGEDALRV